MNASFAQAYLMRLDQQGRAVDRIKVMFNPKELNYSKQNSWKQQNNAKTNVPDCEFSGGGAETLKLQLFFDTYEKGKDVREEYTDKIHKFTQVDPNLKDKKADKGRPPIVRFQWGSIGFEGVITTISQKFTLFLPDSGKPVRAVLDVTLSEVKDKHHYPRQNPTSGSLGQERVWTVREGDTLAWIAFNEYNDATQWRRIADANSLYHVRRLTPGMTLTVPNA